MLAFFLVKATPLHLAAENAKDVDDAIECMKLLLDKGAQINSQDRRKNFLFFFFFIYFDNRQTNCTPSCTTSQGGSFSLGARCGCHCHKHRYDQAIKTLFF